MSLAPAQPVVPVTQPIVPVKPLTVLVTRPQPQAAQWVAALQARGQSALALPLLQIDEDPAFAPRVTSAWAALETRALVMFVSPNAVERFFAARGARAWPMGLQAAATGPGTVAALRAAGVAEADIVAPSPDAAQFDADTLWAQRLADQPWQGRRVLIVRGESGRDWLAQTLRSAGAQVDIVSAYRSAPTPWNAAALALVSTVIAQPKAYAWLFSSSKAIDHVLAQLPAGQRGLALATHPRIAATAQAAGFHPVRATRPEVDAVLAALREDGETGHSAP